MKIRYYSLVCEIDRKYVRSYMPNQTAVRLRGSLRPGLRGMDSLDQVYIIIFMMLCPSS